MKGRVFFSGVVFVGAMIAIPARVVSQDKKKAAEPKEEMMSAWMKAAEPGEHHEHLKPLVGRWNLRVQWRMTPEAEWTEEKATSEFQWIMGGRFLMEKVKGTMEPGMEGTPFEGLGFLGYDNLRKKHTTMWIDNMTTATSISYGTCDSSRKVMTLVGDGIDHMTRQPRKEKSILRIINNDKLVVEMYVPGPDGKEFKSMEITYTRK